MTKVASIQLDNRMKWKKIKKINIMFTWNVCLCTNMNWDLKHIVNSESIWKDFPFSPIISYIYSRFLINWQWRRPLCPIFFFVQISFIDWHGHIDCDCDVHSNAFDSLTANGRSKLIAIKVFRLLTKATCQNGNSCTISFLPPSLPLSQSQLLCISYIWVIIQYLFVVVVVVGSHSN